jgi:hypothetical protein
MLETYTREIALRLESGSALEEVEADLIEPSLGLSDDERAALWLFAWSHPARAAASATARPRW